MRRAALLILLAAASSTANAADAYLDPAFGNGGIVEIGWPAGSARAHAIGLDNAGRIVVGGSATGGNGDDDFVLFRLLPDGTLDATYAMDGDGFRLVDFDLDGIGGNSADAINDMVVLGDGSVVSIGEAHFGFAAVNSQFALVRVDASGNLDPGFGENGMVHFGFANFGNIDQGGRLAVDAAGNIVVAGTTVEYFAVNTPLEFWVGLTRLTPNGLLDPGFFPGRAALAFWVDPGPPSRHSKKNFPYALALDDEGRIALAGGAADPIAQCAAVFRAQPDGDFDPTFGQYSRIRLGLVYGAASALLPTGNGKILIAGGWGSVPSTGQIFLARINDDGSLDSGFASGGVATMQLSAGFPLPSMILPRPGGGWLVAGPLTDGVEYVNTSVVLAEFDAEGNPDPGFGQGGVAIIETPDGRVFDAGRLVAQPGGKLIVAGSLPNAGPDTTTHFAVMRIVFDEHVFADGFDGG